jgi:regulator of protease activity HflC (stomatin/prohibitin superfamily)
MWAMTPEERFEIARVLRERVHGSNAPDVREAGHGQVAFGVTTIVAGLLGIVSSMLVFRSLVVVAPNQSKVIVLFGKYTGTLRKVGDI